MPELLTPLWLLALVGIAAYLIGAIPFGIVMARLMGLGDLRKMGSGNIGATNVMRTGNKVAGVLTFLLDAGKGAIVALIAWASLGEDAAQIAALMAFVGHIYPVYLKFFGGKGVATFIGTSLALAWPVGLALCALWLVTFKLTRYSSLSALVVTALSPLLVHVFGFGSMFALFLAFAVMVFYKHEANIRRLLAGTEARFGSGK